MRHAMIALPGRRHIFAWLCLAALAQGALAQERPTQRTCRAEAVRCCDAAGAMPAAAATKPRFGVHVWPSSLAQSGASLRALLDLRPSDLRFSLGPNWRRQRALTKEVSDRDLDAQVAAEFASAPGLAGQIETLGNIRQSLGARLHLIVWEPPPMPSEPVASGAAPEWRTLASENVALAARFHVANLKAIEAMGLAIDAVELSNEPDGNWNIRVAPADYAALIRAVRSEAARRKVVLPKLYGPGASTVAATRAFFADEKTGKAILGAVDVLSLHVWDDKAGHDRFGEFDRLLADLARLGPLPSIAVTEYGLAKPEPAAKGDRMNVTKRVDDSVALTPGYPPASLRDLLRLYGDRVETVLYWEFQDQNWSSGLFGLVDTAGRPKPIYDVYHRIAALLSRETTERVEPLAGGRLALIHDKARSSMILSNPGLEPIDVILPAAALLETDTATCRTQQGEIGLEVAPGTVEALPIAAQ